MTLKGLVSRISEESILKAAGTALEELKRFESGAVTEHLAFVSLGKNRKVLLRLRKLCKFGVALEWACTELRNCSLENSAQMTQMASNITTKLALKGMSTADNTLPSFMKRVLETMSARAIDLAAEEAASAAAATEPAAVAGVA
jgi:hypothetical protein